VRSFKTRKGPEAPFIPFLWSHSGNCFWMIRLEIYYFELNDAKHCVTLLGILVEECKLAFLSPTSKYVCKGVSNWQSLLIIIALKIRSTLRKPPTCSADETRVRKPPCGPEWSPTVLHVFSSFSVVVLFFDWQINPYRPSSSPSASESQSFRSVVKIFSRSILVGGPPPQKKIAGARIPCLQSCPPEPACTFINCCS